MSETTTTSYLLNEEDYQTYQAQWKAIAEAGGPGLTDAFRAPDGTRLKSFAFPLECIRWLVSAVGVRQIKARFLLMPGPDGARFTLTLFATDESGYRLSAYDLPTPPVMASAPEPVVFSEPVMFMSIPTDLAAIWLGNWESAGEITPAMFATYTAEHNAAFLEGYNFGITDFVTVLFDNQSSPGQNISMALGLHEYHSPTATSETALTQTFGLVLQSAARALDMAFPCPPNTQASTQQTS